MLRLLGGILLLNGEHNLMIEVVIKLLEEHFIALINIICLIKKNVIVKALGKMSWKIKHF